MLVNLFDFYLAGVLVFLNILFLLILVEFLLLIFYMFYDIVYYYAVTHLGLPKGKKGEI